MSSPPTILLLSYHFHPSFEIGARRTTALARFLAASGWRVVVVSEFGGQQIQPGTEVLPGIIAIPVKRPPRLLMDALVSWKKKRAASAPQAGEPQLQTGSDAAPAKPSLLARMAFSLRTGFFRMAFFVDEYKKWSWLAAGAMVRAGREYQTGAVISSAPPHSVLLAGAWAARRLGVPHIADLRDPWSDLVASLHPQHKRELALLRVLEGWVVRHSIAVTSTGALVAQLLSNHYPYARSRTHVIRNGYDGEFQCLPQDTGGRLSILFAGELYAGRNPFPLLSALEDLLARSDVDASRVNLTFMGRCSAYGDQSLAEWLRGKRAEAVVKILPQMPQQAVKQAVLDATVLLNLAQNQPMSVPAKTYEHLAGGREILLVCEDGSETAQVVAGITGVTQVDQSNGDAMRRVLQDLYQRHVVEGRLRAPSEQQAFPFSRAAANQQFLKIISSAVGASA